MPEVMYNGIGNIPAESIAFHSSAANTMLYRHGKKDYRIRHISGREYKVDIEDLFDFVIMYVSHEDTSIEGKAHVAGKITMMLLKDLGSSTDKIMDTVDNKIIKIMEGVNFE